MKKFVSLLLVAVLVVGMFAGCGAKKETPTTPAPAPTDNKTETSAPTTTNNAPSDKVVETTNTKDTLVITMGADIGTLAPAGNAGSINGILWAMYDRLWYVTNDGEFTYCLATNVEDIDETHMKVTLRDDVVDTNGNKIVASDVLFSLQVATTGNGSYVGSIRYLDLEACEAPDDTTVILTLKQPNIMQKTMLQNINIVSEKSFNDSPDGMVTTPVGSGPYVLKDFVMGSYYVMEAKDDYWRGTPTIKTVTWKTIEEESQRLNAMQTGELDAAAVSAPSVAEGESMGFKGYSCRVADSIGVIFNCAEDHVTSNKDLRKALACIIDGEAIKAVAYAGLGDTPQSYLNPGLTSYDPAFVEDAAKHDNYYAYNEETAKAYLAASGLAEGSTLKMVIKNEDAFVKASQIIQQSMSKIGLNLEISTLDSATFNDTLDTNPELFDMALVAFSTSTGDILGLVNTWICMVNYHHWDYTAEKQQVKDLVAQALTEQDETKRKEINRQISEIICEEVPMYSYYFKSWDLVTNADLNLSVYKDFVINPATTTWN